jgi:tetratricopeptide (TPR) repeat protein
VKFSEEAYKYNSKHGDILENLITVYCMEKRFEKALKVAETLLKKNPHTTDAYYYCGLAHEKAGKVKKANRLYKKGLECDESVISNISHKDISIYGINIPAA